MKYKVIFERKACIGSFACVAANAERWSENDDGKADLTGSTANGDNFEVTIEETELEKMMEAAKLCPVNVIHVIDENGKRLI